MAPKHCMCFVSAVWTDVFSLYMWLCCSFLVGLLESLSSTSAKEALTLLGIIEVLSHIVMEFVFLRMSTEQSVDMVDGAYQC